MAMVANDFCRGPHSGLLQGAEQGAADASRQATPCRLHPPHPNRSDLHQARTSPIVATMQQPRMWRASADNHACTALAKELGQNRQLFGLKRTDRGVVDASNKSSRF
jgi:hypothetical protein